MGQSAAGSVYTTATNMNGNHLGPYSSGELLKLCDELICSYNEAQMTPTTHAELFMKKKKIRDENAASFIQQIFFGLESHKPAVKLIMKGFYYEYSGQTIRTDYNMYSIITFLVLFKLCMYCIYNCFFLRQKKV